MTPAARREISGILRDRAARIRANRRRIGSPLQMFPELDNCGYDPGPRAQSGLGDAASELRAMPLPGALERYLATGAPMPSFRRDLGAMSAQVPRLVYGGAALLAIVLAAKSYRKWRDTK